jgi:UDP-3-O-acyl N-acetylglucosamine deacetylase
MTVQKTVKGPVVVEGIGLQTGCKTKVVINSAPADSGIVFLRTDLPACPAIGVKDAFLDRCRCAKRRTTLKKGAAEIHTTEHLLSALYALGISNASIEVSGKELPGLDGSAKEYVEAIERAGIIEQGVGAKELAVEKETGCAHKDAFLTAFPYKNFRISYFLSYPVKSIGEQFLSLDISAETFKKDIAPARTFCMAREAFLLKLLGFGKGADSKNTLIMGRSGPVGSVLRFSDEPVRHKILDLIGDLSLVGMPIKAHIVAVKSGHSLNLELVRKLKGEYHG